MISLRGRTELSNHIGLRQTWQLCGKLGLHLRTVGSASKVATQFNVVPAPKFLYHQPLIALRATQVTQRERN